MAALFRNSNVRMSVITDAFSRLRLQPTRSSIVCQQPTHLRTIAQTRPHLLKKQTGVHLSATALGQGQDHNHDDSNDQSSTIPPKTTTSTFPQLAVLPSPPQTSTKGRKTIRTLRKFQPCGHIWTDEEDAELLRLVKEGRSVYEIYDNHFPYRTLRAVMDRMSNAFRLEMTRQHQVHGRSQTSGDEDSFVVDKVIAKVEPDAPLRQLYAVLKAARAEKRNADQSDGAIQRTVMARIAKEHKGKWTAEEDAMLEQLVQTHIELPQPVIWSKVAGGSVDGSRLLRNSLACRRRWRTLYSPPSSRTGRWTEEEELRLQKAISEQFGGKYQVAVDALVGKPATRVNRLGKWRPELQQLPGLTGLPIPKLNSRRLRILNWVAVSEKVGSRSEYDCRLHFYTVYHNGARGNWTKEEMRLGKEGAEKFGKDYWKIAEYVGTRSPQQVNKAALERRWVKE